MTRRRIPRGCAWIAIALVLLALCATVFVWVQARRVPPGRPDYVSLGSSFAAGAGLGRLQQASPVLCARSINGYPSQLARLRRLSIVDMSCGGAVTDHLLHGGQFLQGPQIRAITPQTRLVTITVGGNDVGYIGDLSMLAARNSGSLFGRLVRQFWGGPKSPQDRRFPALYRNLVSLIAAIRTAAPNARIVVATYPTLLPATGTCPVLGLTAAEATMMRTVGDRLADTTRAAAAKSGAILVDMHRLGVGHDACSADPWTRGWTNGGIAPFHPTQRGAVATARAIDRALNGSPAAVTAVGQDHAAGHQARRVGRQE